MRRTLGEYSMNRKNIWLMAAALLIAGCSERGQPASRSRLELSMEAPTNSNGTLVVLHVRNAGTEPVGVHMPFINDTRLFVADADGKTNVYAESVSQGMYLKVLLQPGQSEQWPIDLNKYVPLHPGTQYTAWFSVEGNQSDKVSVEAK